MASLPRWLTVSLLGVLARAEVYQLGYLYIHSGSSWVVESFSQFKLAVRDVNDAAVLGSGSSLNYSVFDTQGSSTRALDGAITLLSNPNVVGIVGTGVRRCRPCHHTQLASSLKGFRPSSAHDS